MKYIKIINHLIQYKMKSKYYQFYDISELLKLLEEIIVLNIIDYESFNDKIILRNPKSDIFIFVSTFSPDKIRHNIQFNNKSCKLNKQILNDKYILEYYIILDENYKYKKIDDISSWIDGEEKYDIICLYYRKINNVDINVYMDDSKDDSNPIASDKTVKPRILIIGKNSYIMESPDFYFTDTNWFDDNDDFWKNLNNKIDNNSIECILFDEQQKQFDIFYTYPYDIRKYCNKLLEIINNKLIDNGVVIFTNYITIQNLPKLLKTNQFIHIGSCYIPYYENDIKNIYYIYSKKTDINETTIKMYKNIYDITKRSVDKYIIAENNQIEFCINRILCKKIEITIQKANDPDITKNRGLLEDIAIENLINKHNTMLNSILKELTDNKKKIGHWIWWIFPNPEKGLSDDSYVTENTFNQISSI
jgi:hypothetical protein